MDANNFYCACHRVFEPKLEGQPVVVLSNNDGCVVARTNELKPFVARGTPLFQCAEILKTHKAQIYSSAYYLYGDLSARLMTTVARFAPQHEVYSIDECFLTLPGFKGEELNQHCLAIKAAARQETGLPVSLGAATTKTLAKIANQRAKKDSGLAGVLNLYDYSEAELNELLAATPVEEIWGIGAKRGELLRQNGIETAYELKNAPDQWVKKNLSIMGLRTVWELRGLPCLPLEEAPPAKKAICSAKSFGRPIETLAELGEALTTYVSRVAEKLRQQGSAASVLQVFLTTGHYRTNQPYYSKQITLELAQPSSFTPTLARYAHHGLAQIYRRGYSYIKVGVLVSGLVKQEALQLNLWKEGPDPWDLAKETNLMEEVDGLNRRYGREAVRLASAGLERSWWMKQAKLSPHYTTRWSDLPLATVA